MAVHLIRSWPHTGISSSILELRTTTGCQNSIRHTGLLKALNQRGIVDPVRNRLHIIVQQCGTAVNELAEFVHLVQHTALQQILHPIGRRFALVQLQLHLQDGVREAYNFGVLERFARVPMPFRPTFQIVPAFADHAQIGIQGNAYGGVEWNLKGRAHILRSHGRDQLFGLNGLEYLTHQNLPILYFLQVVVVAFALHHFCLGGLDVVGIVEYIAHLLFADDEAFLDADLARPCIAMCLTLHKDNVRWIDVAIPPQANRNGALCLIQPSMIQFQRIVVQIHRIRQLAIGLAGTRLLQKYRQMLQYRIFDGADIVHFDPVLGGTAYKALCSIALVFGHEVIASNVAVNAAQLHHDYAIIGRHPALFLHPRDIE
mmetsp:Transcript_7254/g.10685  ORF Transcript_7254/g.10685 Transcript_7254/m.10685 type:complete len:372 (+) Transcript_7254:769-1884(+)